MESAIIKATVSLLILSLIMDKIQNSWDKIEDGWALCGSDHILWKLSHSVEAITYHSMSLKTRSYGGYPWVTPMPKPEL